MPQSRPFSLHSPFLILQITVSVNAKFDKECGNCQASAKAVGENVQPQRENVLNLMRVLYKLEKKTKENHKVGTCVLEHMKDLTQQNDLTDLGQGIAKPVACRKFFPL